MRQFIFLLFILGAQVGRAQDSLQSNIPVHDPVMIRQDGVYYVFATGRGISMWSSKDMLHWKKELPVFSTPPDWAIEAPFIFKKFDYFYLFASYDYCCRGEKSTYKMRVGRSKTLTGPYFDRDGLPMTQGGGTLLLEGNADWHGVGHNAVCNFDDVDYLVFHGYDAKDKGKSKLRVERLAWENGWPVLRLK
jgi:beta-xylosidase